MTTTSRFTTQALVIGSGIAGATCALTLADAGVEVTLLTAAESLTDNNTSLAQGGIVYTAGDADHIDLENDIRTAGWNQNNLKAVRLLCRQGPEAVKELLLDRLTVPFAPGRECTWDMTREGGHSAQRILHCADHTGREIMQALANAVSDHPNVRVLTRRTAIDLLTTHHHSMQISFRYSLANQCVGAYVLNEESGEVETVFSDFTVLATGGTGQVYLHTTNTDSSIGSGLSMAGRAGANIINSEFVQFHPTAFFHKARRRFLISEAVRGEGARLVNAAGDTFMDKYDERADLAPRDIVTRAIMDELLRTGEPCVYLDVANYVPLDIKNRFPTIYNRCLEAGIDITKSPIPVVPAAHYFCGGILCDTHGRTTVDRLYTVGECACTGVHGANRLASTSLLEGLLWGKRAGEHMAHRVSKKSVITKRLLEAIPDWKSPTGTGEEVDPALVQQDWTTIRTTMWNYVGITRSKARLARAFDDLRNLYRNLHDFYRETPISKPLIDLFHGCQAAYTITLSAQRNKKSSGCHYRTD